MAYLRQHWGYRPWVDESELVDGLEALDLVDYEVYEVAEDGDIPVGRDPLEILLALEELEAA